MIGMAPIPFRKLRRDDSRDLPFEGCIFLLFRSRRLHKTLNRLGSAPSAVLAGARQTLSPRARGGIAMQDPHLRDLLYSGAVPPVEAAFALKAWVFYCQSTTGNLSRSKYIR